MTNAKCKHPAKKKGNVGWQISLTHVRKPVSSLGLSAFSLLAEENTSGLLSLHVLRLLLRKALELSKSSTLVPNVCPAQWNLRDI